MDVPQEIVDQIVSFLPERVNLVNAALVNKAWNSAATSVLYRHIDISEYNQGGTQCREFGELHRMYNLVLTLEKNAYISSLVHSIRHSFYFKPSTLQRQNWGDSRLRVQSLLQRIIDNNGFPRVRSLVLFYPDIHIGGILLKGLLSQIHSLQITSPFFKDLSFDTKQPSGFSNLKELELEFTQEIFRRVRGGPRLILDGQLAHIQRRKLIDEDMHSRVNTFLSNCQSLQVLKITGTKELHTLLQSVNFTSLKVLEIGEVFCRQTDFAIICLNSFLERHPSITRLALHKLPDETSHVLSLSKESALNIREFVSCIEEVPADYSMFLRQFQQLETYRLEHHMIVGGILHEELLGLLPELRHQNPGIKNLTLPMPTHISGWTLTSEKRELARISLMEFGEAFSENVPTVEKFGISQIGNFGDLDASEWALSLSLHPSLRNIAIKTSFLPTISVHEPEGFRQNLINELAREFSVVPKLESFVFFEGLDQQAVKVTIVRMEGGVVEGIEELVGVEEEVDKVFFDDFFDSCW